MLDSLKGLQKCEFVILGYTVFQKQAENYMISLNKNIISLFMFHIVFLPPNSTTCDFKFSENANKTFGYIITKGCPLVLFTL